MFDRARRLAPLCLLAALACKPEPAPPQEPAPEAAPGVEPDRGGPTAAVEAAPAEAEPDPAAELGAEPADAEAEQQRDPEEQPSEIAATEAPEKSDEPGKPERSEKPDKRERPALPKPIHEPGGGQCQKKFAVGDKVENFRLPNVSGDKTISPAGYRNRVVLLNFWGTWCKPCLKELPEFDRLYRKYRRHGMTLVAVATDEDAEAVQAFVDKHKLIAKIALGGEEAAGAYGRSSFPFSLVVDGDGTIVAAYDYVDDNCLGDLEQVIRTSLEDLD